MTWAVEQATKTASQKLVLLMLSNYCNSHSGQCNPSHTRLAEECCMGVSTLKRSLQSLEDDGFIEIIRKTMDGVSLPNQYVLKIGRVGPNRTGGGSKSGRGVGPNRATNQEVEPGIEPNTPISPKSESQSKAVSFKTWAAEQRAAGVALIAADDPVLTYSASVGLPDEFMSLAWDEFKVRYTQASAKRYIDWRAVFRKAVRENWLKLWFLDGNGYKLTTAGAMAQRAQQAVPA